MVDRARRSGGHVVRIMMDLHPSEARDQSRLNKASELKCAIERLRPLSSFGFLTMSESCLSGSPARYSSSVLN
jgi:hypothetical protein